MEVFAKHARLTISDPPDRGISPSTDLLRNLFSGTAAEAAASKKKCKDWDFRLQTQLLCTSLKLGAGDKKRLNKEELKLLSFYK